MRLLELITLAVDLVSEDEEVTEITATDGTTGIEPGRPDIRLRTRSESNERAYKLHKRSSGNYDLNLVEDRSWLPGQPGNHWVKKR